MGVSRVELSYSRLVLPLSLKKRHSLATLCTAHRPNPLGCQLQWKIKVGSAYEVRQFWIIAFMFVFFCL